MDCPDLFLVLGFMVFYGIDCFGALWLYYYLWKKIAEEVKRGYQRGRYSLI